MKLKRYSKVLWFNGVVAALSVAFAALDMNVSVIRDHVSPWAYLAIVCFVAVANFALRFATTQPLFIEDDE